jgi:sugar O-acyltransferase (sialic acid O-acetyltransferase NeuD family)
MKNLVVFGASGFGREVAWLVEELNEKFMTWNLLGFLDDDQKLHGEIINGLTVLGGIEWFNNKEDIYYVCAIGNPKIREQVVNKCLKYNIKPATLIHPNVLMSKFNSIGEGSIICASNIITVNVTIGRYVIINLDCTIGHDAILNDFCTLYPSVNVSGNTYISRCCEMGTGSQIIQGKKIGVNSIIGAGAVVVKDVPDNCTAVGIPAKPIKCKD